MCKIYKNRSGLSYYNYKIHSTNMNTNGIQNVQSSIQKCLHRNKKYSM
jgi:hypothetical protein